MSRCLMFWFSAWKLDALEDADWMDWAPLHLKYPSLNLGDKVSFIEGSILMNENCGLTGEFTTKVIEGTEKNKTRRENKQVEAHGSRGQMACVPLIKGLRRSK
ncbi:hypothetical protein TSUD_215680 [Trifolium subterraneum]|uniref:Uncharacterized protein n=1 Tax=Trifolium subterraneum TaxID=3900 RepID=A0A2Z6NE62_TRISU|nr:hypothetical protein TSUD_215680 [Trifolium subterraneum]